LEFIRAELTDVKKERDYYRDLLFQRLGVVPTGNSIPTGGRAANKVVLPVKGIRATRQRLEAEDLAKYNEQMKRLELEVLAKEIGLESERPTN